MGEDTLISIVDPDAGDRKSGGKSGRWQVMMILCNGLLLTITAFIALVIYVDKMKNNMLQETSSYFLADVSDRLNESVQTFDLLIATRDMGEKLKQPSIQTYLNGIVYAHQDDVNKGQWVVSYMIDKNLLDDGDIQKILSEAQKNDDEIRFYTSENNFYLYQADPVKQAVFVAQVSKDLFLPIVMQDRYKNIQRVRVFDVAKNTKMFDHYHSDHDKNLIKNADVSSSITTISFLNHSFEISLDVIDYSPLFMGDNMPFIILLFGLAMTIIGTLFVRNNHRQSYQINLMNDVLEEKNLSLETKMEEAQEISKALRESEEEYKAVVNSVQDVLFELDATGRIVFINTAWGRLTGIEPEGVYGLDLFKFVHSDYVEQARIKFFEFMKTRQFMKFPSKLKMNDGQYRSVDIAFSVLRKDTSNMPHVIGTVTDIEEKHRAEKALDEVEKRYRKIVENAAGGIYQIAPDGRIMSANPAFAHILGYTSIDEMNLQDFRMSKIYINEKDYNDYVADLERNDFLRNREVEVRDANGQLIWINENARAVRDYNGDVLYYEGSIEDISQRKKAELELMEAKLSSDLASRAKSEFLANMSHELRTPLNSIIGFSEIIKGEALGEIQQKAYVDYAKDIYTSGSKLLTVINEILGISRIEAGERQLNDSIIDLQSVSTTCINLLMTKVEAGQLHIDNLIDENTPKIIAEELAFKQMLMNLLSNAIKFTPAGGTITLSSDYNGENLNISVTDTGIGIDQADITKALSPFGQVDSTLSRSGSGTGLGLTLVDSLIRLHGGKLELISQKNIGTTATLVVPAKRVAVKKDLKSDTMANDTKIANMRDYKK